MRWRARAMQRYGCGQVREHFATHLDELVESYPRSLLLAEFSAKAYADLNRESKYFDALVRLFDMYLEAGNVPGASNALEKLVEIDPYDSRNLQRLERLEGRADPAFSSRIRSRLSQVATHTWDGRRTGGELAG